MAGSPPIVLTGWRRAGDADTGRLRSLRLDGGRIQDIRSARPVAPGEGVSPMAKVGGPVVHDLRGAFLSAGLIDMHVHLSRGAPGYPVDGLTEADDFRAVERNLEAHLATGVTAVRSLGDRSAAVGGPGEGLPRAVWAGRALTPVGGYGSFLGREVREDLDPELVVDEELARGARTIKVIMSGGVDFDRGEVAESSFGRGFLRNLIEACRDRGVVVAAHANGRAAVREALALEIDTIEHGLLMGREEVELLAASRTVWVPTLAPLAVAAVRDGGPALTAVWADYLRSVVLGFESGVEMALGTDGGSPGVPHGSLPLEIDLLSAAGVAPGPLREAATLRAASVLRRSSREIPAGYGRLEAGGSTDVAWFDRDPFRWPAPAGPGTDGTDWAVELAADVVEGPRPAALGAVLRGWVWWSDR